MSDTVPPPVTLSILFVDDEPDWVNAFIELQLIPAAKLRGYELKFTLVETMMAAMNRLAIATPTDRFDLVLLDLNLPDSNADRTISLLPELYHLWPPIIAVTGLDEALLDQRCIAKGADAFLHKIEIAQRPHLAVQEIVATYIRRNRNVETGRPRRHASNEPASTIG